MGENTSSRFAVIGTVIVLATTLAFPVLTISGGENRWNLRSGDDPSSDSIAGDANARSVVDKWLATDGYLIENAGQLRDSRLHYYGFAGGLGIGFGESAVVFSPIGETEIPSSRVAVQRPQPSELLHTPIREDVRGSPLRITFAGSNPVDPVAQEELPHVSHHYVGNDPTLWRTNVRHYREVTYPNLYDGIDLTYRIGPHGLKYVFHVGPGADPSLIQLTYDGVDDVVVDGTGLTLRTAAGEIRDNTPVSYEDDGTPVRCDFAVRATSTVGFSCGDRDASRGLVIDPLLYSRFLGGTGFEFDGGVATDDLGNVYVTGGSYSPDFLAVELPPGLGTSDGDAFVVKLNAFGGIMFATLLSSSGPDFGQGIAVDQLSNIYVTGATGASNFPVWPNPGAFDSVFDPFGEAFVAKLNPTGILEYATFLGSAPAGLTVSGDVANDIAVVSLGSTGTRVYVTGTTDSPDFPKAGAFSLLNSNGVYDFDESCGTDGFCNYGPSLDAQNNAVDAFLVVLSPDGNGDADLLYATFLGGSRWDVGWGVAVGPSGIAYVTGLTELEQFWPDPATTDFPFTITYGPSGDECCLAPFVASLDPSGNGPLDLKWAADLGGSGATVDFFENVYVSGNRDKPSYPCTTSIGPVNGIDAVVSKLSLSGALVYSTCYGGSGWELAYPAVDFVGRVYLSGTTTSLDLPVPGCIQCSHGGGELDGFVAAFDPSGTGLTFSTYVGGSGSDGGGRMAVFRGANSQTRVYVLGSTASANFPTTIGHPYQGSTDAFVSSFTFTIDGDQDGIFDEIDTNPSVFSDVFEDIDGPNVYDTSVSVTNDGRTQGKIVARNGNLVLVDDLLAPHPTVPGKTSGMIVGVFPTASTVGDSEFRACPSSNLPQGYSFLATPGTIIPDLTCGSLTVAVVAGQVTVVLPGIEVVVPAGASVTLSEAGFPAFLVTNDPASSAEVIVNGVPLTPGTSVSIEMNVEPVVTLTGPPAGAVFAVNTPVVFTGTFTDANAQDTHTAQWDFAGIVLPGTVTESGGSGSVSDTFAFTAPGVYLVKLTATDSGGVAGVATTVDGLTAMVVIYDPNGGFVTGGGWIDSPQGAYSLDPTLAGKAVFGFVSKYKKGANVPTGQTEFQFRVASLNFRSSAYEWLVVSGCRAQFKGSGTINGAGDFGFLLTVIDGQQPGGGGVDKFRIKVWDKATGQVIYDNQPGDSDAADATSAVNGSIVIHKS